MTEAFNICDNNDNNRNETMTTEVHIISTRKRSLLVVTNHWSALPGRWQNFQTAGSIVRQLATLPDYLDLRWLLAAKAYREVV